jgi:glyoxylase-like metal-dependent hydrolase (beta-lactamase superfamily II)
VLIFAAMTIEIAQRWFETKRIDDDITLLWEPHVVSLMRCNIWHVRGRDRDLMIDTGMGVASLREAARHLLDKKVTAVATHVHADHVGGHHEFDDCLVHRLEAGGLARAEGDATLLGPAFDARDLGTMNLPGYSAAGPLITALPHAGYDLAAYRLRPARVTRAVEEGDIVDLGDRRFEVLHLPGHSPGSIGLWESASGILFSGDAIYDGELLDRLHHSDIAAYVRSLRRLRELPVRVVHGGHLPSFGRERMRTLIDDYLAANEAAAAPGE